MDAKKLNRRKRHLAAWGKSANRFIDSISNPQEEVIGFYPLGDNSWLLVTSVRVATFELGRHTPRELGDMNPEDRPEFNPVEELAVSKISLDYEYPKAKGKGKVKFFISYEGSEKAIIVPVDVSLLLAGSLELATSDNETSSLEDSSYDVSEAGHRPEESTWNLGSIPSNVNWKSIPNHLANAIAQNIGQKESPLFFISDSISWGGALVALEDRCLIVKSGLMGGFMAGSLGGSRVTSFYYRDINAVEYNSGLINGVLELLTASYNGSENRDYWKGTNSPRNANSSDPWTLSNTLPLSKLAYQDANALISQLREMIRDSKETKITVNNSGPVSIADELAKLAELKSQGVISEDDFQAAKAKLLK